MPSRAVARLVAGTQTMEGDGMDVMRAFPAGTTSFFDPFLLGYVETNAVEANRIPPLVVKCPADSPNPAL